MAWNYPDISLEEMMKLIKGFVDIMILASGYRSSGLLAHWDASNIKKAFQWGSFFENVLRHMSSSDVYQDSVKELDMALLEMTSDPSFPQGLANLSCDTLSNAQNFVLLHLFHLLPLRDSHLQAFLMAVIEMDIDKLSASESDRLCTYLDKLTLLNVSSTVFTKQSDEICLINHDECNDNGLTKFALQEIFKRQFAVSCTSTVERGLDVLSNAIKNNSWSSQNYGLCEEKLNSDGSSVVTGSKQPVDFVTWNNWKSDILAYFLDKRTVRLVSGASMIFSAPKIQWKQVFERLNTAGHKDDNLIEIIELLLIGCIANKWQSLVEYFTSTSYDRFIIPKLYQEVNDRLIGRIQTFHAKDEGTNSKEGSIVEYLMRLLGGQLHPLWKLSPVLAAVAIPFWSPLFRLYLSEIETQLKWDSSLTRCCSCMQDGKEHGDCQLAERIWCLYIFHVCGSHVLYGVNGA